MKDYKGETKILKCYPKNIYAAMNTSLYRYIYRNALILELQSPLVQSISAHAYDQLANYG